MTKRTKVTPEQNRNTYRAMLRHAIEQHGLKITDANLERMLDELTFIDVMHPASVGQQFAGYREHPDAQYVLVVYRSELGVPHIYSITLPVHMALKGVRVFTVGAEAIAEVIETLERDIKGKKLFVVADAALKAEHAKQIVELVTSINARGSNAGTITDLLPAMDREHVGTKEPSA